MMEDVKFNRIVQHGTQHRNKDSAMRVLKARLYDIRIKENQANLTGAQATLKSYFLLDATGPAPIPNAEFYCGVFGKTGQTANSAAFYLNNLPPAKYAVALLDATSSAGRTMLSEVLQQVGADWKLGGLYIKPAQIAGHDSEWFLARAREYKTKASCTMRGSITRRPAA